MVKEGVFISVYRGLSSLFIIAGGLIASFYYITIFTELENGMDHWSFFVRLISTIAMGVSAVFFIPIIAGFITAIFGLLIIWKPHPIFSVIAFILCGFLLHIVGSPLVFIGAILGIIASVKEDKEDSHEEKEDTKEVKAEDF
ncbi:hypothetical protein [Oceanobacillus jeddahense]|uniref:hypothetical protein n=1 Tax=Oceanobacillus jeddahense TaxID=1462527 RepID=UPI000595BFA8|nr:hypothetical protein [Oceanobacillus jeddahense]